MAYIINKFNGEQLVVLEDGTIDTSTSINLVGRNYVGYGESQNENFVFLLENFANDAPPSRPLTGQIWFNTSNNGAYVYNGTNWSPVGTATLSDTEPSEPNSGSLWLDTTSDQLKIYNGSSWNFIGPEAVAGFGITRARSTSLDDYLGNPKPVIILETDDTPIAICTAEAFTVDPNFSVSGFSNNLIAGINLSSAAKVNGDITGNSGSTTRLVNPRLINGVPFDGQQNITIKSSTTNKLVKGTYIVGQDFDGGTETTWSVDATSSNVIGKVVARNSQGGFSAGTITASFIGNLTGNVNSTEGFSSFNEVRANTFVGATLTGNAFSASQLETARKINGVSFNGTSDITITAAAGTLTGNTLNSTVTGSNLQRLGTLVDLSVADAGINVGTASQLVLLVESSTPTIRSQTGTLNFDMGSLGPDISFVDSTTSLALGGPSAPAIIGDNTTNLGISGHTFDKVYANNFIGNADTATLSTTANNLSGGGLGAIPYQTSIGTTSMLGLGADNYILRSRPSGPSWEPLTLEQLNKGDYVNMINTTTTGSVNYFNSSVPVTISVDATSNNTASKIVARDASGNFSAGTITATIIGNVTGNTAGTHTGNVIGNITGNVTGDLTGTATNATNATYTITRPTGTSNTTIASTAFVQQEIGASRLRSLVISSGVGTINVTSPTSQYIDIIQAYMPANTVSAGTQFSLIINNMYASSSSSVSGSQWISAYRWGSLSVGTTTTLYDSTTGFKLIYQSNGSSWSYTGLWGYV